MRSLRCAPLLVVLTMWCLACAPARSAGQVSREVLGPTSIGPVVDSLIESIMRAEHIPGAVVVVVRGGSVVHARGYGVQDPRTNIPVHVDSTLFAIGSITKLFTATAAMQLVHQRRLSLHTDLVSVVKGVRIPQTQPGAVTLAALLSHTAGFDEIRPGTQAPDSASVLRLGPFLQSRLVRFRPVGEVPSYSTYGITLAGLLIEETVAQPYEAALRTLLLDPLGMRHTHFDLDAMTARHLAPGFEWVNGAHQPQPREWYHTTPASSLLSTASDMGRFILAHLGHGQAALPESLRVNMQRPHGRGHSAVPGVALGFFEGDYRGVRVLEHGGAVAGTSAHLVILPELDLGWYVASHHEANAVGARLKEALIDRFQPRRPSPPEPSLAPAASLQRFAGRYRWDVYCRSCGRPAPSQGPEVTVHPDGSLGFAGQRWVQVDSLLFRREDGARVLGFRADRDGAIRYLFIDGPITFERIP